MLVIHIILAVVWVVMFGYGLWFCFQARNLYHDATVMNQDAIATLRKYNEWLEEDMQKPSLVIVEDGTIDG